MTTSIFRLYLAISLIAFFACEPIRASDKVSAEKILESIKKGKTVFIQNKTITGKLDFTELNVFLYPALPRLNTVEIPVAVYFENCEFEGEINAFKFTNGVGTRTIFGKSLTFFSCKFRSNVNFKEIEVRGESNFENNIFLEAARFDGSRFWATNLVFNQSIFKKEADFSRAIFEGKTTWRNVVFEGNANFQNTSFKESFFMADAIFNQELDFSLATFWKRMSFNHVVTIGSVTFSNATFLGQADFLNNEPSKELNFEEAVFHQKARFEPQGRMKRFNLSKSLILYTTKQ